MKCGLRLNVFVKWLISGAIVAVIFCVIFVANAKVLANKANDVLVQNIHQPWDIKQKVYTKVDNWLDTIKTWGLVLTTLITPATLYFTYKHPQLTKALRLFMMAENLTRLLYCLEYDCVNLCHEFNHLCPKNFVKILLVLENLLLGRWFLLASANCQMLISINRFFALTFRGSYFKRSQKWPLLQLVAALSLAVLELYPRLASYDGIIIFYPLIIRAYNLVMDCFTFAIFHQQEKKRQNVGMRAVEKRFLLQMATYQCSSVVTFLILPPIVMGALAVFGLWVGMAMTNASALITNMTSTLGQSLANLILIRHTKSETKPLSNVSFTVSSRIFKN